MSSTRTHRTIRVDFPGGVQVRARLGEHTVLTDQPAAAGGQGLAPAPFDLLLASLATCAGYYALQFCQSRGLPTDGLAVEQSWERDPETHRLATVRLALTLPEGFPDKYRGAIVRATDQCAVKRLLDDPPRVETSVVGETSP